MTQKKSLPESSNINQNGSSKKSSSLKDSIPKNEEKKKESEQKKQTHITSFESQKENSSASSFKREEVVEENFFEKEEPSFKVKVGQTIADAFDSTLDIEVTKNAKSYLRIEDKEVPFENSEEIKEEMIEKPLEENQKNSANPSFSEPVSEKNSMNSTRLSQDKENKDEEKSEEKDESLSSSKSSPSTSSNKVSSNARFSQIVKVLTKYHALKSMTPQKLRMILEDLGPTYVKFGQILSSRQDLLPPQYTHELEKLRSNVNPLPYEVVREEIIKAYGKAPEEIFASFSQIPLGAASMAQVHEATTKDGQKVVIKVQRPGIREQMQVDVEMMRKGAKLLSKNKTISSLMDLPALVEEFWTTSQEELDFRHEANNANRFAKQMEGLNYIKVPKILNEFTRSNMLVMEDIGGIELDDYPALAKEGYSREEIAMRLGLNFLDQIINYGYFHADPHSGNIKIDDGRIAWIDFGMMGEINQGEAKAISSILKSLSARDVSGLAEGILQIGIPPKNLDYVGFCNTLENYLNRYISQDFNSLDLGQMVEEAIEICHQYKIKIPKGIAMLGRSLITIQGTLKDLNPQVNMLAYISKEKTSLDQIDWNQEIESSLSQMYADYKALLNMPLRVDRILGLLQKGQLRVGISVADLEESILPSVNQIIDRVVVVILIAALLVGSSIVCTTHMKPTFLDIPLLGFAGFFVSFCLSLWLFYKMLFRPKKGDKLF